MAAGDVTRRERETDDALRQAMMEWQSKYVPINADSAEN